MTARPLPLAALLAALAILPGSARAADDWKWTESAGWARYEGSAKGSPTEQYAFAYQHEKRGEYYDAARQYFLLVRTFPDSDEAKEAIVRLSGCLFQMENYYHSFKTLEECIEKYPKSIHLPALLELEFRIGQRFLDGAPVRLFGGENARAESWAAAVEVFEAVYAHDRAGAVADAALVQAARAYLELGKPEKAKDRLSIVIAHFRESDLVPLARYLNERADLMMGRGSVDRARQLLRILQEERARQPEGTKSPLTENVEVADRELQESDARQMIEAGDFYTRRGGPKNYDAALFTYQEILRRYPRTTSAALAQARIEKLEGKGRPRKPFLDGELNIPDVGKLFVWRHKEEEESGFGSSPIPADASLGKVRGIDVVPGGAPAYHIGPVSMDLAEEERSLQSFAPAEGGGPGSSVDVVPGGAGSRLPAPSVPAELPSGTQPGRSYANTPLAAEVPAPAQLPAPPVAVPAPVLIPRPAPRNDDEVLLAVPGSTERPDAPAVPEPRAPAPAPISPAPVVPELPPVPEKKTAGAEKDDEILISVPGDTGAARQ